MAFKNVLFYMYFSLAFVISGFCINLVQFFLFFTVAWFNIKLYRKLNYYLIYSIWSQIVALAQWWANTELTIYYPENSKSFSAKNLFICLMNHTFEIDWVVAWLTVDHYHKLGNAKSFVKKSLRFLPIIGWSWIFGEFTFLERNLEKDSQTIVNSLKRFLQFESPISLLFFAEGTRFTKEKHANSVKFANERGLTPLKHHLLPRARGFYLTAKTLKEIKDKDQEVGVCQLQLRFPKETPWPTFMSLLKGERVKADLYIRMMTLDEVPTGSDKETTDYLYDLYKKQDDLVDYYEENGHFPGVPTKIEPRRTPLINWIFWLIFTFFLMLYLLSQLLINGSWLLICITFTIFVIILFAVHTMINSTKIKKGSSYGIETAKKK